LRTKSSFASCCLDMLRKQSNIQTVLFVVVLMLFRHESKALTQPEFTTSLIARSLFTKNCKI
jgi:hypothetical protein